MKTQMSQICFAFFSKVEDLKANLLNMYDLKNTIYFSTSDCAFLSQL